MRKKLIEWLGAYTREEYKEMESSRDIWRDKYNAASEDIARLDNLKELLEDLREKSARDSKLNDIYKDQIVSLNKELRDIRQATGSVKGVIVLVSC